MLIWLKAGADEFGAHLRREKSEHPQTGQRARLASFMNSKANPTKMRMKPTRQTAASPLPYKLVAWNMAGWTENNLLPQLGAMEKNAPTKQATAFHIRRFPRSGAANVSRQFAHSYAAGASFIIETNNERWRGLQSVKGRHN